jgi:hypothetical protein
MSCGLEFFSTEVSAAPPKVIAHVSYRNQYRKRLESVFTTIIAFIVSILNLFFSSVH